MTKKYLSEFDERQLNLMIKHIDYFKFGKLYIGELINNLEGLLNAIEEKDKDWEVDFRTNWLDLEIVYAFALYQEANFLDLEDERIVFEALEKLVKLIRIRLVKNEIRKC